MPVTVTGAPTQAVVTGIRTVLAADATLIALVTGIYGHVSEASRTIYPYIVLGRRSRTTESGAMHTPGSTVTVQIDVWHGRNDTATSNVLGPGPVHTILSRIAVLLTHVDVTVTGYTLISGSLICELEEVFDEPDPDSPDRRLYHGVQRWQAEVHET